MEGGEKFAVSQLRNVPGVSSTVYISIYGMFMATCLRYPGSDPDAAVVSALFRRCSPRFPTNHDWIVKKG